MKKNQQLADWKKAESLGQEMERYYVALRHQEEEDQETKRQLGFIKQKGQRALAKREASHKGKAKEVPEAKPYTPPPRGPLPEPVPYGFKLKVPVGTNFTNEPEYTVTNPKAVPMPAGTPYLRPGATPAEVAKYTDEFARYHQAPLPEPVVQKPERHAAPQKGKQRESDLMALAKFYAPPQFVQFLMNRPSGSHMPYLNPYSMNVMREQQAFGLPEQVEVEPEPTIYEKIMKYFSPDFFNPQQYYEGEI